MYNDDLADCIESIFNIDSGTGPCEDKDENCPQMAKNGECYTHYPWAEIFEKCPKSCHQCGKHYSVDSLGTFSFLSH